MMSKHIGLVGYAQSGKDTVAEVLCREFGYSRRAFADPLRQMLEAIDPIVTTKNVVRRYNALVAEVGYEGAKRHPEVRRLLQRIGTEAGRRVLGEDVWIRAASRNLPKQAVFTDVRFPNECDFVRGALGGAIVLVRRPGVGPVNGHASERLPEMVAGDWIIENDGTLEDLAEMVREMMRVIGRRPDVSEAGPGREELATSGGE